MPKGEHLKNGKNMATRFSSERQPERYRQPDKISALLKQELASDGWAVFEDAELLDDEQKPTGKKVAVRIKLTTAEAVAKRLLANAAKGRERSIEIVLERTEGKVPQENNDKLDLSVTWNIVKQYDGSNDSDKETDSRTRPARRQNDQ